MQPRQRAQDILDTHAASILGEQKGSEEFKKKLKYHNPSVIYDRAKEHAKATIDELIKQFEGYHPPMCADYWKEVKQCL